MHLALGEPYRRKNNNNDFVEGIRHLSQSKRRIYYIMQNIFCMQVLGTEASPSQWRLYSKKDNDGNVILEPISVRNNMSRCIINNIDKTIEGAISNGATGTLIVALSKYKAAIDY